MRRLIVAAFLSLAAVGAARADDVYLFDLLKDPAYKAGWTAMLNGARRVEPWIAALDGPATPAVRVTVAGETYLFTTLCKAHDCGDNMLNVLFAPGGAPAYALLVVAGAEPRWLGKPSPAVRKALRRAAEGR